MAYREGEVVEFILRVFNQPIALRAEVSFLTSILSIDYAQSHRESILHMTSSYAPPNGNQFQVNIVRLSDNDKQIFVGDLARQLKDAAEIIVVWNKHQVAFVSPHSERDQELARDMCEWLKARNK